MYNPYRKQTFDRTQRKMTVVGIGEVSVKPNIVKIQFNVITKHEQINKAQQENSYQMNQVIQSLVQFGIHQDNIQTTSFEVRPVYDYVDGKEIFRGYEVINTITVRTDQLDQVGRIIEIAIQNGANQIFNLELALEQSQIFERQALHKALEDAHGKAQAIAQQMHLNLDPIPIKIEEDIEERLFSYAKTSFAEFDSSTPVEPGLIQIQAKVRVNFRY